MTIASIDIEDEEKNKLYRTAKNNGLKVKDIKEIKKSINNGNTKTPGTLLMTAIDKILKQSYKIRKDSINNEEIPELLQKMEALKNHLDQRLIELRS